MPIKKYLTAFLILFFALPVWSATYYVNPNCTGDPATYVPATESCTGGSAQVYDTIADVNGLTLSPNDVVSFAKGESWSGTTLWIDQNGTSGNPITYTGHGSGANPVIAAGGQARAVGFYQSGDWSVLDGLDLSGGTDQVLNIGEADNVTVQNCTIRDGGVDGLVLNTADNITVTGNTVKDNDQEGILVCCDSDNATITKNEVFDNCEGDAVDYLAGIKAVDPDVGNVTISENKVYSNGTGQGGTQRGVGIHVDTCTDTGGHTVRHNIIYDNNSIGFLNEDTNNVTIYGNISWDNAEANFYEAGGLGGSSTNKYYNNTSYSSTTNGFVFAGNNGGGSCTSMELKNNISLGNTTHALVVKDDCEGNITISHNSLGAEAISVDWDGSTKTTYDTLETSYGATTNSIELDCLLTNPDSDILTLNTISDCNPGNGTDVGTYTVLTDAASWPSSVTTTDPDTDGFGWPVGAYGGKAEGTALYVSNSGADTNVGTQASPVATISFVNAVGNNLDPADTVYFDKGDTWRETLTIPVAGTSGNKISWTSYGSGADPIISGSDDFSESVVGQYTADGGDYYTGYSTQPKQVFINGSRLTKVSAKVDLDQNTEWWDDTTNSRIYLNYDPDTDLVEASQRDQGIAAGSNDYQVIDGLTIKHANDNGVGLAGSWYSELKNCTLEYNWQEGTVCNSIIDGVISNNVVRYNGGSGIGFMGTTQTGMVISENTVYENCQLAEHADHTYAAGIRGGTTSGAGLTIIVEKNLVYDQAEGGTGSGNGIHIDTSQDTSLIIVRHNRVYDNWRNGILIEQTYDVQVYGNITYGHTGTGFGGIATAGNLGGVHETLVYNNTSYGNYNGVHFQGNWGASTCVDNVLRNNISFGNSNKELRANGGCENDGTNGSGNVYNSNAFGEEADDFIMFGATNYDTYDLFWQGESQTDNNVEEDPLMTDPASGDFTLKPNSPCIGAGTPLNFDRLFPGSSFPSSVITGPVLNLPDMGAFEYPSGGAF